MKMIKKKKCIHDSLKKICLQNKKDYKKYKNWCDKYFYSTSQKRSPEELAEYFLIMKLKSWIKNFKFVRELGLTFIDISNKVINRKKKLKMDKEKIRKNNC